MREPSELVDVSLHVSTADEVSFMAFSVGCKDQWERLDATLADEELFPCLKQFKIVPEIQSTFLSASGLVCWGMEGVNILKLQGLSPLKRARRILERSALDRMKTLLERGIAKVEWPHD